MNNPIKLRICSHCGTIGNGNLTWDYGWEFNCYCCSQVDKIPDNEIPPELHAMRYKYSEHILKSNGAVTQGNFPRNISSGIKED